MSVSKHAKDTNVNLQTIPDFVFDYTWISHLWKSDMVFSREIVWQNEVMLHVYGTTDLTKK